MFILITVRSSAELIIMLLAKILRGFKNNRIKLSTLSMFLIHLSCLEIVVIVSLSIL